MEKEKFLGICIVIAAILLAGAIVWHARTGHYQFAPGTGQVLKMDTTTGTMNDVKIQPGY